MTPHPGLGHVPAGQDGEAYARLRRRVLWSMPTGLYVVGSRAGGTRNLMTLSWASQLSLEPKLVGISVERQALTHRLVADGGVFSLCLIDRHDRAMVRKFVKPLSETEPVDPAAPVGSSLGGFAVHQESTGAPVLDQALAWLDCQVRQAVPVGTHTLFVGEVVDAGFATAEDTPVLRMEDTRMSYGG
ncbi:MAG: hypothetical protein DLM54_05775 [Acidimicrobiales bacterium]|nr:MAG: hypothetical protein DLM54_05775 [Acidimicrobiales bacterium]